MILVIVTVLSALKVLQCHGLVRSWGFFTVTVWSALRVHGRHGRVRLFWLFTVTVWSTLGVLEHHGPVLSLGSGVSRSGPLLGFWNVTSDPLWETMLATGTAEFMTNLTGTVLKFFQMLKQIAVRTI